MEKEEQRVKNRMLGTPSLKGLVEEKELVKGPQRDKQKVVGESVQRASTQTWRGSHRDLWNE